jgi:predicted Mrr-cat superfamily restriction endonuclease
MTVWLLHLPLTPAEEASIRERKALELPLGDVPDLTGVVGFSGCRRLLQALHPDEPPEATLRQAERLWALYGGVQPQDIIAVPLPRRRALALAEVRGPYRHEAGPQAAHRHLIPVVWHDRQLRLSGSLRQAVARNSKPMAEIEDAAARIAIRDRLPHAYNRFAGWKWLTAALFGLGTLQFLAGLLQ